MSTAGWWTPRRSEDPPIDKDRPVKRTISILIVSAAMAMGPLAGSATAATSSTVRSSETMVDDGIYCYGEVAEAIWTYDIVEHTTVHSDGQKSATANIRAEVTWTQDDEDFVARFAVNYRFTDKQAKYIAKGTGVGSLGTRVRFDEVIQATITPDGYDIKQYRDDVHCTPARR
jgi:hypothetical protein